MRKGKILGKREAGEPGWRPFSSRSPAAFSGRPARVEVAPIQVNPGLQRKALASSVGWIRMGELLMDSIEPGPLADGSADFRTTHWSQVLAAGQGGTSGHASALDQLCRTYWYPIYVYVRREGHAAHDAQDLTQDFFARLLRLNSLEAVAPHKGRFRTFLLASLKHFLADARDAARSLKRGGSQPTVPLDALEAEQRYQLEPVTADTPDVLFDRRWALALLEQSLARLRLEYQTPDKTRQFEQLKEFLQNPSADGDYDRVAARLQLTPGAVAVAVHRLRQRYRDLVRTEIAHTVTNREELAEELRHFFGPR
jgi:RNA polymerase sigma factor (sigma-70 family)